MERRKWQERWTAQCAELEELKKRSQRATEGLKDVSDAKAALRERLSEDIELTEMQRTSRLSTWGGEGEALRGS